MKPKKLVISAFGPYADRMELDFERLGGGGLYLITVEAEAGYYNFLVGDRKSVV